MRTEAVAATHAGRRSGRRPATASRLFASAGLLAALLVLLIPAPAESQVPAVTTPYFTLGTASADDPARGSVVLQIFLLMTVPGRRQRPPESPAPRRRGGGVRPQRVRRVGQPAPPWGADDRFIAQGGVRSSRVQALLGGAALPAGADAVLDAPRLNEVERQGEWLACVDYDLGRVEPSLGVTIPARFTEMLSRQPEEARAWRMVSRAIFHTYLARGYRVTDFSFEPGADRGTYLLEAGPVGTDPRTRPLA